MSAIGWRSLVGLEQPGRDGARPQPYTQAETVLVLVAALAATGSLIHIGAAVDHWRQYHLYTVAFASFAAVQATWALLILRGASRGVLVAGSAFQLALVVLWLASRTVGVPLAPASWTPEEIGVADVIATVGELCTVLAVASVLSAASHPLARRARGGMAPLLLLMLLVSALFGTVAHAG